VVLIIKSVGLYQIDKVPHLLTRNISVSWGMGENEEESVERKFVTNVIQKWTKEGICEGGYDRFPSFL